MRRFYVLGMWLIGASFAAAADWPQWLGPNRDGSTTEKIAPWKGDVKVLWRQAAGEGHSSPVVVGGNVFLFARQRGQDVETIDGFDAATGKPVLHHEYPRGPFQDPFG